MAVKKAEKEAAKKSLVSALAKNAKQAIRTTQVCVEWCSVCFVKCDVCRWCLCGTCAVVVDGLYALYNSLSQQS